MRWKFSAAQASVGAIVLGSVLLAAVPSRATWFNTAIALGGVRLDVTCATVLTPPPALSPLTFFADATIPGTIPLPAACNRLSSGLSENGELWMHRSSLFARPGSGDGLLDAATDLVPFITPSPIANIALSVTGTELSSTQAEFTVTWSGSNESSALRIRAFDYSLPLSPGTPPGFNGDVTSLPDWSTSSTLLFNSGILVGDGSSHMFSFTVTGANLGNLIITGDDLALSAVPEPSNFAVVLLGFVAMIDFGRRILAG
jgi:hypothetical protein